MRQLTLSILFAICALIMPSLVHAGTPPKAPPKPTYNHDMSAYRALAVEAGQLVVNNKMAEAVAKTKELETAFDNGTKDFKKADKALWTTVDTQMDVAMKACAGNNSNKATAELAKFIKMLDKVSKQ